LQIAFTANQQKALAIKDASGGAPAQEAVSAPDASISAVNAWSRDGRFIFFQQGFGLNLPIKYFELKGDRKPVTYGDPESYMLFGSISPDGRWVAYTSIVGAMPQLFVAPFPWTGEKWQVSVAYGIEPRWRADGKELYYYDSTGIVAVAVDGTGKAFHAQNGRLLFPFSLPGLGGEYDVSRDGQKFIAVTQTGGSTQPLTLVQNWTAQLKQH
jgi:Tol biopolymer transport system component